MANKTLQFLRNSTIFTSRTAALTGLENQLKAATAKDGEPILARYTGTDNKEHTLLGIKSAGGYEIFDNEGSAAKAVTSVQYDGDNNKITYTKDGTATDVVTTAALLTDMDLNVTNIGETGKVITVVGETNGKVTATATNFTDVILGGYSKTADTGAIDATDTLEKALSKLENTVATNAIVSDDSSITVAPSQNKGTSVVVNVDGTTIVKANGGALKADLKILKETTGLATNVKEQYKLVYGNSTTAIGDIVTIYKDSALVNIELGHVDDTLKGEDPTTHESASSTIVSGSGDTALVYVMQLANGNYKLAAVNVQSFLEETEFSDGLQVNNHVVSVKLDASGDDTGAGKFLTVGSDGLKLDGVSDAINTAKSEVIGTSGDASTANTIYGAKAYADAAVVALDAEKTSTDGTNVQVKVTEVDGKITAVNITTDNTVNSTNVNTAITTAIEALDATDTAVTNQFVTAVSEANGVISVTRAQPAAGDVSFSNTHFDATTVDAALAELAVFDAGVY
jgi:hypothetical protein